MHSPSNRGFTLVELLVGVAIIVLIAAIAIPVLTRARAYSYGASALGSLRSINAAQSAYASSCGAGFYAPSLTSLATPPTNGGGDTFVSPDLGTDPAFKSTYTFTLTPGLAASGGPASCNGVPQGASVETYFVAATPPLTISVRHFGTNQAGTIYSAFTAVAVTQTGVPNGADPIQ